MKFLYSSLILLSIVHHVSMDDLDLSSILPVELVGPKNFVALGGNDLTIRYRLAHNITRPLAPSASSSSTILSSLSLQLVWLQDDGIEQIIASQKISSSSLSYAWQEVNFECGLVVHGGYYNIRLVGGGRGSEEGASSTNHYDYPQAASGGGGVEVISNVSIRVVYPVIDFEVPHRLETYTTSVPVSFGLTRSLCKPKRPLPSTVLTLSLCKASDTEACTRDFVTILQDPLKRLQTEGQATVNVECHFWGKNATYRVQIQETFTKLIISMSERIKVEWSPRFAVNFTVKSILPCPTSKSLRVLVSYPHCVLPEKDKIRVYGYETLVPSLLAVNRVNYVGEKQIRPGRSVVTFSCNIFTPRFTRYCFQYISTAVDDSVSVVVEKCLPTLSPDEFSDEYSWGPWGAWSHCSSTCGSSGRQYRYRFCDSPHPTLGGANFCQGNSIEEQSCDTILPDCPTSTIEESGMSSTWANEEMTMLMNNAAAPPRFALETSHSSGPIPLHPPLNMNLSTTLGCECGCILDNIVPGINSTLVVIISSNQSSCGDQDEEDHHHLKWILSAKQGKATATSRIRLDVVDIDLHCLSLKFRDGNTSDSNLLDVFTSSRSRPPPDPQREQTDDDQQQQQSEQQHEPMTITVESTGTSLSIAAAESNQNDCSFQFPFLYLVAYYQATASDANGNEDETATDVDDGVVYEFWTFLIVKIVLSLFVLIVLCSTFGGCATKVYHKYKYKQLKWSENELVDEEGEVCGGGDGGDNSSRCTSVTLMSFDYGYWKRIRIQRLKYFLLKPKKLNTKTAKVKSYPTTPTHFQLGKQRSKCCTTVLEKGADTEATAAAATSVVGNKHLSLSETNLCEKVVLEQSSPALTKSSDATQPTTSRSCSKKFDNNNGQGMMTTTTNNVGDKSFKERYILCGGGDHGGSDGEKYKLRTTTTTKAQNRGRPALISITVPDDDDDDDVAATTAAGCTENEKLRKEKENLKRRQSSELMEKKSKKLVTKLQIQNGYNSNRHGGEEVAMKVMLKRDNKGKSQVSVSTIHSVAKLSSSCDTDSTDRVDMMMEGEEDADQDGFEMDYYDYDVENVGNIPGSYLGLEPAFVLWNSETAYPYDPHPEDQDNSSFGIMAPEEEEEEESSLMERDDECSSTLSMTESRNNSSDPDFRRPHRHPPPHRQHRHQPPQSHIKETSLHTFKFADDDEDDDEDNEDMDDNTQASDSLFDHHHH